MTKLKNILYGIGAFAVGIAIVNEASKYATRGNLIEEDFEKANWIQYNNLDNRIWDEYTSENISHNQDNWHIYLEKVRGKNSKNLQGTILLPDLDKNGHVGNKN